MENMNEATPHLPLYGLSTDTSLEQTPDGNLSFGLNIVMDDVDGAQGTLVSENANKLCVTFPDGFVTKGIITLGPTEQVYLGYIKSGDTITSYIFLVDFENCTFSTKLQSSCANLVSPITGEFRMVKGCERVIYWHQDGQPDRFLNLDKVTDLNPNCNDLRLNPDVSIPQIELESVNDTGGYLPIGTYAFQLEYLTGNQEVIYRSYITPTTPVTDDPLNSAYDSIDGALNIDTNLADVGGVPVTNKSITLNLSNLDTRFPYYRINVVRYINSDGLTPSTHQVGTLFNINGSTDTFTYTGFNPANGDILIDYAQINVPVAKYESSRALEQVQNRMLRGSVKENARDYSGYQRIVNEITTRPLIGKVSVNDQFSLGDSKNPNTYWESVGYQSDEIYPLAVVFVHSNGDESPAFHIPGRESNAYDTDPLVVGTDVDEEETRHLGLTVGQSIERWKVFNTGDATKFAYHESATGVYPISTDCNGDAIFGDLAGQPVRHHRFPSRKEVPLTENDEINILGIQFDNIQYPDADIIGHYIVRGKRDSINRTVLDSGYLKNLTHRTDSASFQTLEWLDLGSESRDKFNFVAPKIISQRQYLPATHFTFIDAITLSEENDFDIEDGWQSVVSVGEIQSSVAVTITNRSIEGNIIMNPQVKQQGNANFDNKLLENYSVTHVANFISTTDIVPEINTDEAWLYYVVAKKEFDVFSNILNINYYRTHSSILQGTSSSVFGGDVFIVKVPFENIYVYTPDPKRVYGAYLDNLYIETELNLGYRVPGLSDCNRFFQFLGEEGVDLVDSLRRYFIGKVSTEDNDALPVSSICPSSYRINPDLNRLSYDTNYQSLSLTFDYCSKCLRDYKNRIVFSEKAFQDDLGDNYRTYLANNYVDLPSNRGGITSMTFRHNKLLVRCTDGLFILFPNPQKLQASETDVYIGTGDFLALPESEIMVSDGGYAGQQSINSETMTPYGVVWVDENRGKIFMYDDNLEEISRYKMYHWFEKNLKPFFKADLKYYGVQYNPDEFGCRLTYDPKFERVIVHKRDFKFTNKFKQETNGELVVESIGIRDGGTLYEFTNPEYFINKSWTLSYSIKTKTWTSWHSYQPDYMSYGSTTFYSTLGNKIWSHDDYEKFNNFYGKQFPFIIEFVDKQFITNHLHAVHYWATVYDKDVDSEQWEEANLTFDKAVFYTHDQSSGLVELEIPASEFETIGWSNLSKPVIQTDKNWKVAQLRDIATSTPVNSMNWDVIQSEFTDGQGYIDKLPINVDFGMEQYDLAEFRNKWIACRFIFNSDKKMVVNLMVTSKFNSIR